MYSDLWYQVSIWKENIRILMKQCLRGRHMERPISVCMECEEFLFHINAHKNSPLVEESLNNHLDRVDHSVGIHGIDSFLYTNSFSFFVDFLPALAFLTSYSLLCFILYTWLLLIKELVSLQKNEKKWLFIYRFSSCHHLPHYPKVAFQ